MLARPHAVAIAAVYSILASPLHLATVDVSSTADFDPRLAWQEEDLLMNSFGAFLKRKFGGRTQRVSIDAGFTCPNVDGAVARGGVVYSRTSSFSLVPIGIVLSEGSLLVYRVCDRRATTPFR